MVKFNAKIIILSMSLSIKKHSTEDHVVRPKWAFFAPCFCDNSVLGWHDIRAPCLELEPTR